RGRNVMTIHAQVPVRPRRTPTAVPPVSELSAHSHLRWLLGGLVLAFGIPFAFADLADIQRDVYYAIYIGAVLAFFTLWARQTRQPLRAIATRRWRWALLLGAAAGGLLALIVLRQSPTSHPHGWAFAGAILWRGVAYGA